ncbi:hypothetical protein ASZ90_016573 [hydrocarbon metagenome]|uniref:PEGA domain-containing protein n=1 Tax=hydrocarbon metagenome TaxID=938273 RepID=A0A0W8ENH9_9ZZZZ
MIPHHRAIRAMLVLLAIAVLLAVPVTAATTELRIVRYAADGFTILNETRMSYQGLEGNLPVQGDGTTHYYHQGPIFVDDPDPEREQELRWNPEEDTNIREKDMGAVKGTDLRDICELVGGMADDGDYVVVKAQDGFTKRFAYENVYYPQPRQGRIVVCWYNGGYESGGPAPGYVPGWSEGMRLVFFADTSTNPWGLHVFGNADARECLPEDDWHYYWQGTEKYPTTTGFTVQRVSEILIYTQEEPSGSIKVTSTPAGASVLLDGAPTGLTTPCTLTGVEQGGYSVLVLLEGYEEPYEQTVYVTVNKEAPVHFNLLPALPGGDSTQSGSSSDDPAAVPGSGSGEWDELELYTGGSLAGTAVLVPGSADPGQLTSGDESKVVFPGLPSSDHPFSLSRLYVYSSDEQQAGTTGSGETLFTVTVAGITVAEDAQYSYEHEKTGRTTTRCYNLTGTTLPAGDLTVMVRLDGPRGTRAALDGAALLLLSEDTGGISHQSWVAEGSAYVNTSALPEGYSPDIPVTSMVFAAPPGQGFPEGISLQVIATTDTPPDRTPLVTRINHRDVVPLESGDHGPLRILSYDLAGGQQTGSPIVTLFLNHDGMPEGSVAIRGIIYTAMLHQGEPPPRDLQSYDACSLFPDWCSESQDQENPSLQEVDSQGTDSPSEQDVTAREPPEDRNGFLSAIGKGVDEIILFLFRVAFLVTGESNLPHGDSPVPFPAGDEGILPVEERSGPASYDLTILSSPEGAGIGLNGRETPATTPCLVRGLPGGEYVIQLSKPGFLPNQTSLLFQSDQQLEVVLVQEDNTDDIPGTAGIDDGSGASLNLGGVYITMYPSDGDLYLDGKRLQSSAPVLVYGIRQGPHQVRVSRTGTGSYALPEITRMVWVYPGTLTPVFIDRHQDTLEHTIALSSADYEGSTFSVNGMFPAMTLPARLSVTGFDPFVTVSHGDAFLSFPIPPRERSLGACVLDPANRQLQSLKVESTPEGASIFIDGFPTGMETPCLIPNISDGHHRVVIAKPGHLPVEQEIFIPIGEGAQAPFIVRARLENYGHGSLLVESDPPGSRITLNGLATGERTPCLIPYLPIGIFEVTCTGSGSSRTGDVQILPFRTQTYRVILAR